MPWPPLRSLRHYGLIWLSVSCAGSTSPARTGAMDTAASENLGGARMGPVAQDRGGAGGGGTMDMGVLAPGLPSRPDVWPTIGPELGRDAKSPVDMSSNPGDTRPAAAPTGPMMVYVGSGFYSGASALHVLRLDLETGGLTQIQKLVSDSSPSFLAVDPKRRVLFVNIEGAPTAAASYAIDPLTGMLSKLNHLKSGEDGSAYLSVDATGRFIFQANYSSGSISVLSVKPDGLLDAVIETRPLSAKAFPHSIRPDPSNRFVFVPNRTGQIISQFKLDADTGKLTPNTPDAVPTPAGTGPRHIDFHPTAPFAYVINETNSTVTAYKFDRDKGTLTSMQIVSTIPPGFTGTNATADMHVHPNGRLLFGANRGHGSLAIFTIDVTTGMLTAAGHQLTGGTPRNFSFDPTGRYVAVGNLEGDTVAVFGIDGMTGKMTRAGMPTATTKPSGIVVVGLGQK